MEEIIESPNNSELIESYETAGPQGPQGFQGPQGLQGTQGSQGPQGVVGAQGEASTVQGPQGDQGPQGTQGLQGSTGADSTVQGPQGSQGNQGSQGPQGVQGTAGVQGVDGIDGPQGPQGSPSTVQGPQGSQGVQGTQGLQGSTGADSTVQGPQGNQGSQGAQGLQGSTGADSTVQGPQGNQGPQGVQGNAGGTVAWQGAWDSGTTYNVNDAVSHNGSSYVCVLGTTNNEPPNGTYWNVIAEQGAQGINGQDGAQGAQGSQGIQGEQGLQGAQGTAGTQGVDGQDGAQGAQGDTGPQGAQGAIPGGGAVSTVYVAADNSSASDKANADYVCDGTADQVEINLAIVDVATNGGAVVLARGTYAISASIEIDGGGDADSPLVSLSGAGRHATILQGASNINVIQLAEMPSVQIENLHISLSGTGDGINCVEGLTGDKRGLWHSNFKNLYIVGDFGTHTGWGMSFENPFRSTFENIQINGIGNGINLESTNPAFNPGNLVLMSIHVDVHTNNGVGYRILSADDGGFNNIMTFIECDCIDSSSGSTTSIGWDLLGSTTSYFKTRNLQVLNTNVERFNTGIHLANSVNNFFRVNYIDSADDGVLVHCESTATGNIFELREVYIPSGQTMEVLLDANTDSNKPNTLQNSFARVESTAVMTMDITSATILKDLTRDVGGVGTYPTEWDVSDTKTFVGTPSGSGAVDSVNSQTGVVVLDADDIDDTSTTHKFVTSSDITKLSNLSGTNTGDQDISNFETTTQLNTRDTNNRARANHTGTQIASTISDFQSTVSANTDVSANTSVRHDAVTLGTANGLSLAGQALSLATATTSVAGAMSASDKTKLNGVETGAEVNTVDSVAGKTGAVTLVKADVGLGNVDNVSVTGSGVGTVVHGSTAGTARPTGFARIIWIGTVAPSNATTNDIWLDIS